MTVEYRGPHGLRRLAELLDVHIFDRATKIELTGQRFTHRVIGSISTLKYLESVTLRNTDITELGVAKLANRLPNCQIRVINSSRDRSSVSHDTVKGVIARGTSS